MSNSLPRFESSVCRRFVIIIGLLQVSQQLCSIIIYCDRLQKILSGFAARSLEHILRIWYSLYFKLGIRNVFKNSNPCIT